MNVTQSLFGMTPQALQAQRAAEMEKQALQFARLTPMESARMGLFQGINQLGNAIGSALGYEDPEMAQAKARQGLLGGLNMADPQALREAARNADPATAQALINQALEVEKKLADVGAKEAQARKVDADLLGQQTAFQNRFMALKSKFPEMSDEAARGVAQSESSFNEAIKAPKVNTQVVETAEGVQLINKDTGQVITTIGAAPDRRQTTTNVFKTPADTIGLVKGYEDLTKPEREMLKSAQTSKELINNAASSNNSQAWEAARTQIAKAVGEGKLSNEDIRRTGVDPRLVQGALDWVNKKIEGVPNQSIMQQLYTVASILERTSVDRINQSAQRTRSAARVAGVPEAEMDVMFPLIPTDRSPRRSNAGAAQTSRGTKYQIIED
jgi:hypothetical protein